MAPAAMAVQPSWTGQISAPMPANTEESIIINLREQRVLVHEGPVSLDTGPYHHVLLGGFAASGLDIEPYDLDPSNFGTVCVRIINRGWNPEVAGTLSAPMQATNQNGETGPTGNPGIPINNAPGPVVNSHTQYACEEESVQPNRPPTVLAGPDITVDDSNGRPGETFQITGVYADDPDNENEQLTYAWYRQSVSGTPISRELNPRLDLTDGVNSLYIVVTDPAGLRSEDRIDITVNAPRPPTAHAGDDRIVNDSDRIAGEDVTLNGSGMTGQGRTITEYEWRLLDGGEGGTSLGTDPTLRTRLTDGDHTLRLTVTDSSGYTGYDDVQITVIAPRELIADAGDDRSVADTDNAAGELVTLDGSESRSSAGGISYQWYRFDGESWQELGSGVQLPVRLPDGENTIRLVVSDNSESSAEDTVTITVAAPASSGLPTANAGADRTVNDTDQAAGENVTLDGSASTDPGGQIVNYTWTRVTADATETLGSGVQLPVRLPDGANTIRLTVTDNSENSASDTVVITVGAAPVSSVPTANAGADRTIEDTDHEQGEDVTLDGSWSVDPDGTLVDYAWSRVDGETITALGSGPSPTLRTRLPDGDSVIQLVVTDNSGSTGSDTVLITVNKGTPAITELGEIPGLTPNQKNVADALDRICAQLRDQAGGAGPPLTGDQQDLLNRCNGLQMNNTTANQVSALDELVADDFAVARTQTLLFANTMYAGVMDRLMALRGGAKGLSLAGLNIMVDGSPVPLAQLQDMVKDLLGGGASADEPGGLLNDKWGLWARGNYSTGEKDRNTKSPGFDADQWAMIGGLDYRYNDQLVGGVSLAYGQSSIDIDSGGGGLETDTYAVSLYGSSYIAKQYYVDAIINVADADYGADRNIAYVDGAGLVGLDARGETSGMTYSAGISGGRDFLYRGFTMSPTLGFFYIDATIDSFTERGAGGLNLIYDEQSFQSFTGNLGFRVTYAWNTAMGVLLPHVRIDYVREFKDDVDVFGVRFAADPGAASTPPILVATDNPDESYWRLATGMSAQFPHGISGYVEYQRLESFEFISFQDVSLGLRFQKSF
jgi:uncharacterized protein YhjY with autotransporter beta-barrel domain